MKRFLLLAFSLFIAFLLLTLAYDALNLFLVRGSSGNTAAKMERLFSLPPDALDRETPIIGSSRACGNYVPSILGTNVFNYGINGSCIRETIFQLDYLVRHKRQGVIIVNLDPWGYAYWGQTATSGFNGNYRLAALHSEVRDLLPSGLVSGLDWVPGIRFQGKLRGNLTAYINARKGVTSQVDHGAVLLKNSRTTEEWKVINAGVKPERFVPPSGEAQRILDHFAEIADRDLTIVWVVAPASSVYRERFSNVAEFVQYVRSLDGKKAGGVRHRTVDLYSSSEFTDADFVDPSHLNLKGAGKFTRMLLRCLNESGVHVD